MRPPLPVAREVGRQADMGGLELYQPGADAMDLGTYFDSELDEHEAVARATRVLKSEFIRLVDICEAAVNAGNKLVFFGNGGSAATASHLAEDLATYAIPFSEPRRLKVLSLNDSPSTLTALGNDIGFEAIFTEQVQQWARPGDLVLTMSGSGNSPNLVAAIEKARELGCQTSAMTGFSGGKLKSLVQHPLHVEIHEMQPAQDAHMIMTHMIIDGFRTLVRNELAENENGGTEG